MTKWKFKVDFGNVGYYECPNCGYGDDGKNHWDSPFCPVCGQKFEQEEDEGEEICMDVPLVCVQFECKHNDGTGICDVAELISPLDLKCIYKEIK